MPQDWAIEFSDPVFGNRWGEPDQLRLRVKGRSCPSVTTSQHDRRFIYGGPGEVLKQLGHGACSGFPDMPTVDCPNEPALRLPACPEKCGFACGSNAYCDCGRGICQCNAGFSGENCELDICGAASCSSHGKCTSEYLGGLVSATSESACACDAPWTGPKCDQNPCQGQTCGGEGHGTCVSGASPGEWKCECQAPWTGPTCQQTCDGFCRGSWPYK